MLQRILHLYPHITALCALNSFVQFGRTLHHMCKNSYRIHFWSSESSLWDFMEKVIFLCMIQVPVIRQNLFLNQMTTPCCIFRHVFSYFPNDSLMRCPRQGHWHLLSNIYYQAWSQFSPEERINNTSSQAKTTKHSNRYCSHWLQSRTFPTGFSTMDS